MLELSEDSSVTTGPVSPFWFQASPALSQWARGSLSSNYARYLIFGDAGVLGSVRERILDNR